LELFGVPIPEYMDGKAIAIGEKSNVKQSPANAAEEMLVAT
jgi:hypothetical protein